jgi:hypothetical protein
MLIPTACPMFLRAMHLRAIKLNRISLRILLVPIHYRQEHATSSFRSLTPHLFIQPPALMSLPPLSLRDFLCLTLMSPLKWISLACPMFLRAMLFVAIIQVHTTFSFHDLTPYQFIQPSPLTGSRVLAPSILT